MLGATLEDEKPPSSVSLRVSSQYFYGMYSSIFEA